MQPKEPLESQRVFTIPNLLTSLRILLVIVFVLVLVIPQTARWGLAAIILVVASLTDWLDGLIARRFGQMTRLGALGDTIADRLLLISALVVLLFHLQNIILLSAITIILLREIGIFMGAAFLLYTVGSRPDVIHGGKAATAILFSAIVLLYGALATGNNSMYMGGTTLFIVGGLFSLISATVYAKSAMALLHRHHTQG